MEIDASIDALADAMRGAGVEWRDGEADPAVIDEIARAIEPLRLPRDLLRFWQRMSLSDPVVVTSWPEFCTPYFALNSWRQGREEFPGQAPSLLFMVAYESWSCMSMELAGPHGPGGALFQWSLDGETFLLRHHRLGDWLEHLASLVNAGSYERFERSLTVSDPFDEELAGRGQVLPPHPVYGETREFPKDPEGWPTHWQRASRIEVDDLRPHGATHTIAEVLASDPASELAATIEAKVIALSGQRDTSVRVSDGTGEMDVLCPAITTALGPSIRSSYEFDIVVPTGHGVAPGEEVIAASDPDDAVQALTEAWSRKYPIGRATAIATAVRRMGGDA
jgi:hypothetical protein